MKHNYIKYSGLIQIICKQLYGLKQGSATFWRKRAKQLCSVIEEVYVIKYGKGSYETCFYLFSGEIFVNDRSKTSSRWLSHNFVLKRLLVYFILEKNVVYKHMYFQIMISVSHYLRCFYIFRLAIYISCRSQQWIQTEILISKINCTVSQL